MNKQTPFDISKFAVLFSLLLFVAGCGPKVTDCVIDIQIKKAHCVTPDDRNDFDLPLDQMDKFTCVSADDFSEILRGNGKNVTTCTIINASQNDVYCNTTVGSVASTLEAVHKWSCFSADDWATILRYITAKKAGKK